MIEMVHGQYAWLLLGFLPGVWLTAQWLLGGFDPLARRILSPVLAYVMFILAAHVASLITHSLYWGVSIASIALGIAGYISLLFARKPDDADERLPKSLWVLIVLSTMAMTVPIFGFNFYDELSVPGHQSTASEMLNGYYPPVYLAQPSMELRYHYGFDLLTASARMMLGIRVDQAIDLISVLLWMLFIPTIWLTGERLFMPASGIWAAIVVPFGAGFTFLGTPTRYPMMSGFSINSSHMMLPLVTNFFQRPWAIGVPAMCLGLILIGHCANSMRRDRRALVALFAVIGALPIIEAAVFATLVLAAGIYLLARFLWKREVRVLEVGIVMIIASLAASRTHGMFLADPRAGTGLHSLPFTSSLGTGGIGHGAGESVLWNLLSFGVRLPLGLWGFGCVFADVKTLRGRTLTLALSLSTWRGEKRWRRDKKFMEGGKVGRA